MDAHFFATVSRMKYIERWALMRSSRPENLSEHSLEVSMIAHALCTIGNVRYNRNLNAERAALIGLYHDASEIITGDMPTPVKYLNEDIRRSYKAVESQAEAQLLQLLPEEMRPAYGELLQGGSGDTKELVKAADKLAAYIKCIEELRAGNEEFRSAEAQIRKTLEASELPEIAYFMERFLPAFGMTLDELTKD